MKTIVSAWVRTPPYLLHYKGKQNFQSACSFPVSLCGDHYIFVCLYFVCMSVLPEYSSMHYFMQCSWRLDKGIGSPGIGVLDDYVDVGDWTQVLSKRSQCS